MAYNPKKEFPNHYIFEYKNAGPSRELLGTIGVFVYFIDAYQSTWTEMDRGLFKIECDKALDSIKKQAKTYGKTIHTKVCYTDSI